MWMGRVTASSGVELEWYRHYRTRHDLNIDDAGQAYRFDRGGHELWRSSAIARRGDLRVVDQRRDACFAQTYEPGDRLVRRNCLDTPLPRFEVLAEEVFACHNRKDRPDCARRCRSARSPCSVKW